MEKNPIEVMSAALAKEKVKWKVQTKKEDKNIQMMVCYFDKRDAIDRLNAAFGTKWSAQYKYVQETHMANVYNDKSRKKIPTAVQMYGIECTIITPDSSRSAIAEASDIEPLKSSRSNSLKLAAGMYGFAAELYEFPKVNVELKNKWPAPDQQKMDAAFDAIYDLHMNGKTEVDVYYICKDGHVWTFGYGKKQTKVWTAGKISSTPKPPAKKTTKTAASPKAKTTKTAAPKLLDFPTHSTAQPDGGKFWVAAIKAWDGFIHTSKVADEKTGEKFPFVVLDGYAKKGTKSFHKVSKGTLQLLVSLPNFKPSK